MKTFKEFLIESSWSKLVYHATYNPQFDPKNPPVGTHVGTLHAAMTRAHRINDDNARWHKESPLHVHAFKLEKGNSVNVRDNKGDAFETGAHDTLAKKGIINPLPEKKRGLMGGVFLDRDVVPHLQSELAKKGITHLSYKNKVEDPGSTSHVVYDTSKLQHVHTFNAPKFVQRK